MNSLQQLESVYSTLRKREISQYKIWVPFHDKKKEGEWRDFYNHQALNFTPPWAKNEPNGGTTENCAVAVLDSDVWWDVECKWNGPTCLCQTHPSFHVILRGLCDHSAVDKAYQPMNDYTDFAKLQLVGHQKSKIDYDEASKSWKLSSAESDVSGISNASHQTFLIGRQSWSIIGDSGCKTNGEEYTVQLKLTGCNATGQFTCDDGQCVTMEQRSKPFLIKEYQTVV